MRRFSLSTLGHARLCPGSAVLSGYDSLSGDAGSAIHEGVSVRIRQGEGALGRAIAEICERWHLNEVETAIVSARLRSFQPVIPDGALSEVPLALFDSGLSDLVRGGRGRYDWEPEMIIAGTIDLLWSEPEPLELTTCYQCQGRGCYACVGLGISGALCPLGSVLHTAEIKSGLEANVPRVARNAQDGGSALLASRWTRATDVVPHTCFVAPGEGRWDDPEVALDVDDLDRIEAEIRKDAGRVAEQERRLAAGEPLHLVTGPHCTYCHARAGCPAHLAEVRALVAPETTGSLTTGPLTHEQAKDAASKLARVERIADQMRQALKAHSDTFGPIELGDGRVWGLHDTGKQRTTWDPIVTFNALCDEPTVGRQFAARALATSETSVKQAIEAAHADAGISRKVAPTKRAVYADVAKAGGITKAPKLCYGPHHPGQTVHTLPDADCDTEEDAE